MNYYNENDPFAAKWLENLIEAKQIPAGKVDPRNIKEVTHDDIKGFTQHHWFAGIGGWSRALELAGWDSARPIWTGSCPCQPLSCAGKGEGADDNRHLWPELYRLTKLYKPHTIFGEQVASPDGIVWFDGISFDLEEESFAIAAVDLPGACVGAPHNRQRLFWVADTNCGGRWTNQQIREQERRTADWRDDSEYCELGNTESFARRLSVFTGEQGCEVFELDGASENGGGLGNPNGGRRIKNGCDVGSDQTPDDESAGSSDWFGDAGADHWNKFQIAYCDETAGGRGIIARRTEPGIFPLAHGVSGRVAMLRAYGNAIIPQVGAKFIRAFMEVNGETF